MNMSKVNIEDLTILYSELTRAYYIANPNNTSVKKEVTKEVEALINKALTKLSTIEILVDKKKFNTNDIELLRASIIEVLERDEHD